MSAPTGERDNASLAQIVQRNYPALSRISVVVSAWGGYLQLSLSGAAKDLIRAGFCSSEMLERLPACGVKYFRRPYRVHIKRGRSCYRVATTYYFGDNHYRPAVPSEIEAMLGLPPGALASIGSRAVPTNTVSRDATPKRWPDYLRLVVDNTRQVKDVTRVNLSGSEQR